MSVTLDLAGRPALAPLGAAVLCTAGLLLPVSVDAQTNAPRWRVSGGDVVVTCPLTVGGSFEAVTKSLQGELGANPAAPATLDGQLAVDLDTLKTGIALRDRHLTDRYLETGRDESFARAVLSGVTLDAPDVRALAGASSFRADLTLHGVTRSVSGQATIRHTSTGAAVEATFAVFLSAFEISPPRYLGIGVRDEVRVRVAFTAVEVAGPGEA